MKSEERFRMWDDGLKDLLRWFETACATCAKDPTKANEMSMINARMALLNHCERLKDRCKRVEQKHGIL